MVQQAKIKRNGLKQQIKTAVQDFEDRLKAFPDRWSRHVILALRNDRLEREIEVSPLCGLMIPQKSRLCGGGYVAALLLKILIIAYLEAKDQRLPINVSAWRRAAEQDPSTPALREAIRGYEKELSQKLASLFGARPQNGVRGTSKEGLSPFTDLCRPCVQAMIEAEGIAQSSSPGGGRLPRGIARQLFGDELVEALTSKSCDPADKTRRANSLSKLGLYFRGKVEFLKEGGRKNG